MKVLYGKNRYYDGTHIILTKPIPFVIPGSDNGRLSLFNHDPDFGIVKHILVEDDYGKQHILEQGSEATLTKDEQGKYILQLPEKKQSMSHEEHLRAIHASLVLHHGSFEDEFPEQMMATMFIKPENKVLEIGANIGRNTLIIAKLLADSRQLTTLESHPYILNQLYENRKINSLQFTIVDGALSKRKLIQNYWNTQPIQDGTQIPQGWQLINTITWSDLNARHGPFDTLVADCEGALYYILLDEPAMLKSFNTIIVENDYTQDEHWRTVHSIFTTEGFEPVYTKAGGWGPCESFFFQVWQRRVV